MWCILYMWYAFVVLLLQSWLFIACSYSNFRSAKSVISAHIPSTPQKVRMWFLLVLYRHWGPWGSEHGGAGLTVGLDGLSSLFPPSGFYDSTMPY